MACVTTCREGQAAAVVVPGVVEAAVVRDRQGAGALRSAPLAEPCTGTDLLNQETTMPKITMKVLLIAAILLAWAGAGAQAMPCTSAGGCADCENDASNEASCTTVSYDAHCNCSISANNRSMCILSDICDYSGGAGGGGTGGGGSGGGGTSCTRPPGGWCSAECSSCGTVFWH